MPDVETPAPAAAGPRGDSQTESPETSPPDVPARPSDVSVGLAVVPTVARVRLGVMLSVLGFFFVGVPLMNGVGWVEDYKVQILGKYLCLALVALGADLIWGYTGLLSLCQALFFCIGGYAVAMHLSLPQGGGIYDVPQFLTYVYYGHANPLPPFWRPFTSLPFAVLVGLVGTATLAGVFGFFIFRSRVRGVYFSIITQAVAWGMWSLICLHEMLMGGTNGLTNFSKSFSQDHKWVLGLYLLTAFAVVCGYLACLWIVRSRLGRVMVAIRDKEMRLYFAGYKPHAFKVFAFVVGALLAALGGMLYPAQVGIITPQNMNVEASIAVVIMVAIGGRGRLWGAIFGALLVSAAQSALTSDMPDVWPFVYGALFLAVILFFPDGLVALWVRVEEELANGWANPMKLAGAALPLATLAVFVLAESLGMVPRFLQRELALGWVAAGVLCLLVAAGLGVAVFLRFQGALPTAPKLTGRLIGAAGAFLGVGLLAFLTHASPHLKWKYILVVALLACGAALQYVAKRAASRPAGFPVLTPALASAGAKGGNP